MYHLQHKQLANTMENMQEIKDMIGFLGHLCFLEHQRLLAKLEPNSGSHGKHGLLGLSAIDIAYSANLTDLPGIVGLPEFTFTHVICR